jgi:hypothetical protein
MIKSTTLPINPRIVIITAGLFPTQHAQCLAKQMKKIIKEKCPSQNHEFPRYSAGNDELNPEDWRKK